MDKEKKEQEEKDIFSPQEHRELKRIARGMLRDAKKMIRLAKKLDTQDN